MVFSPILSNPLSVKVPPFDHGMQPHYHGALSVNLLRCYQCFLPVTFWLHLLSELISEYITFEKFLGYALFCFSAIYGKWAMQQKFEKAQLTMTLPMQHVNTPHMLHT